MNATYTRSAPVGWPMMDRHSETYDIHAGVREIEKTRRMIKRAMKRNGGYINPVDAFLYLCLFYAHIARLYDMEHFQTQGYIPACSVGIAAARTLGMRTGKMRCGLPGIFID